MPALPAAPRTVRCAIRATYGDDLDVLNIFHLEFTDDGPYVPADLLAVGGIVFGEFHTQFGSLIGSAFVWQDCTVKDISVLDGAVALFQPEAPVAGGNTGAPLPANCALVVSWKEDISYRGGHPRTYLCAIPDSVVLDPQHITAASAALYQSAGNLFIAGLAAADWPAGMGVGELVAVHYHLNGAPLTPPQVRPLRAAVVNTRLDSQRRRLQR